MAEMMIKRSGRCIGGDSLIVVQLEKLRSTLGYKLTVYKGDKQGSKPLMMLRLRNCTDDQARTKFYDVFSCFDELFSMTEEINDDE